VPPKGGAQRERTMILQGEKTTTTYLGKRGKTFRRKKEKNLKNLGYEALSGLDAMKGVRLRGRGKQPGGKCSAAPGEKTAPWGRGRPKGHHGVKKGQGIAQKCHRRKKTAVIGGSWRKRHANGKEKVAEDSENSEKREGNESGWKKSPGQKEGTP